MPFCRRSLRSLVEEVLATVNTTLKEIRKMAATQADLDAQLATVNTDLASLQAANQAVLAKLSSITPGSPAPDFSAEVAQLQTIDAALNALTSSDTAATAPSSTSAPASGSTPAAS